MATPKKPTKKKVVTKKKAKLKPKDQRARMPYVLRGRPPDITQEKVDQIVTYVEGGNYLETAAIASGVPKATFYDWMKRGKALRVKVNESPKELKLTIQEGLYLDLSDSVEEAAGKCEVRDVDRMRRDPSWNALAWRMSRKNPDKWGNVETRRNIEVNENESESKQIFKQRMKEAYEKKQKEKRERDEREKKDKDKDNG